jgi:hypothetical protein
VTDEQRKMQFLDELAELTRKHGIAIGGCGCCGSPWLDLHTDVSDLRAGYSLCEGDQLKWISPGNARDWKRYQDEIGR